MTPGAIFVIDQDRAACDLREHIFRRVEFFIIMLFKYGVALADDNVCPSSGQRVVAPQGSA